MNDVTIIINCTVAQTRAALVVDDIVRRFWFGAPRGSEGLETMPLSGERYCGRITARDQSGDGFFVDIGNGATVYMRAGSGKENLSVGAYTLLQIQSGPREAKNAVGVFVESCEKASFGMVGPRADAIVQAVDAFDEPAASIVTDDGAGVALLRAVVPDCEVAHEPTSLFERYGVGEALSESFAECVSLPGGARLHFHETEGGVLIDVDTGGRDGASTHQLRKTINRNAAARIALEIERRNLAGQILIDFLKMSRRVQSEFSDELRVIFGSASYGGWTRTGIYGFTRMRRGVSLLEQATETGVDAPTPGRRFTLNWQLRAMFTEVEIALRADARAQFTVSLGYELDAALTQRQEWLDALRARYAARFTFVGSQMMAPRDYSIV